MLITLKTLQEDDFTVEIDPSETVRAFKEKIEKVKGESFPAKFMKLLYGGKYLLDNNRICDYNLEEKKFVIAVVKPPKAKVIRDEEPNLLDDLHFPQLMSTATDGPEHERAVANRERMMAQIEELGFTRVEAEHALQANYNNLDRAIDFLISNFGSGVGTSQGSSANNDPMPGINDIMTSHNNSQSSPPGYNSILPSQERIFEIFREAVAESGNHTRTGDQTIEEDGLETCEELEEFAEEMSIRNSFAENAPAGSSGLGLHASVSPRFVFPSSNSESTSDRLEFLQTAGEPEEFGAQGHQLNRDKEAMDRLKQLGFSDQKVFEAYFVCEKNENAAANYLFTQYD